jgi:hypothetical protein
MVNRASEYEDMQMTPFDSSQQNRRRQIAADGLGRKVSRGGETESNRLADRLEKTVDLEMELFRLHGQLGHVAWHSAGGISGFAGGGEAREARLRERRPTARS